MIRNLHSFVVAGTGLALVAAVGIGSSNFAHSGPGKKAAKKQEALTKSDVRQMTASWPQGPRSAVEEMMNKYGVPDGAMPMMVVWKDSGPFKRTIVHRDPVDHEFPKPHKDYVEQVIDYQVPPNKFDDLAYYDGSVVVNRTVGEMSARCDKEKANFLALNLAHDIVEDKKNVKQARLEYARTVAAMGRGQTPSIVSELSFTPPDDAGFSDQPIMNQVTRRDQKRTRR